MKDKKKDKKKISKKKVVRRKKKVKGLFEFSDQTHYELAAFLS